MKKKIKIVLPLLAIVLLFYIFWENGSKETEIDMDSLSVEILQVSFVYDVNNVNESVGMMDYVFVGKVISNDGTEYENVKMVEDENGGYKKAGSPYTNYTIQVVENLKGELQTDAPIQVKKQGGVSMDQESIILFENDILPKEENTYIFLAYTQSDGTLLVSGPATNVIVEDESTIEAYKNACANEIVPVERERVTSIYEKK